MNTTGVLVLSEVRGDTRRYRALHLVEQFQLLGVPCEFVHMADLRFWTKVDRPWDAVIFHRVAYGKHVDRLLARLNRYKVPIFSDFDDLIFEPEAFKFIDSPDFNDPTRTRLYIENMENIRRMLEASDGVIASTNFLTDRISDLGKQVSVHRNAFSLEMLAHSEAARRNKPITSNRIVIGYASGTLTHNRDFDLVRPALQEVMRRNPHVVLRLVGPLDPGIGWEGLENRIERTKLVPWRKLPEILAGFDINLAPLVMDNPFAQSKSEIKFMEAAMVETATIASATDAFKYAIREGETGFLIEKTDDWEPALQRLVDDMPLCVKIGTQAWMAVEKEYHPVRRSLQLSLVIDQLFKNCYGRSFWKMEMPRESQVRARSLSKQQEGNWLPVGYEKDPTVFHLGFYSLRRKGLWVLLKQVWIYFRRLVAPVFPFKQG